MVSPLPSVNDNLISSGIFAFGLALLPYRRELKTLELGIEN
jgi:hypothetical protein